MTVTAADDDGRVAAPIAVGLVTLVLTSTVVILRFISRGYILRVLSLTDAAIAFSLVSYPIQANIRASH
jgi:hypothetical protein